MSLAETDDEYPVFINDTNYDSDTSFIYFASNDDPEGYTDYESDTTPTLYDTNFAALTQYSKIIIL